MAVHARKYLLAFPVVILVAALVVSGRAGSSGTGAPAPAPAPARRAIVASPCGDKGTIAASALRVPVGTCDLIGRTVTYESAKVVVPARGKRACGQSIGKGDRYTVCAIDDGPVYAITGAVTLPAACLQTGAIQASLLRTPVRSSLCDLAKRLVVFDGIGAHVPATGSTVCNDADDGASGSVTLCITRDTTAVFAVATSS